MNSWKLIFLMVIFLFANTALAQVSMREYKVRQGDTFISLAKDWGISVEQLKGWNPEIRDIDKLIAGYTVLRYHTKDDEIAMLEDQLEELMVKANQEKKYVAAIQELRGLITQADNQERQQLASVLSQLKVLSAGSGNLASSKEANEILAQVAGLKSVVSASLQKDKQIIASTTEMKQRVFLMSLAFIALAIFLVVTLFFVSSKKVRSSRKEWTTPFRIGDDWYVWKLQIDKNGKFVGARKNQSTGEVMTFSDEKSLRKSVLSHLNKNQNEINEHIKRGNLKLTGGGKNEKGTVGNTVVTAAAS